MSLCAIDLEEIFPVSVVNGIHASTGIVHRQLSRAGLKRPGHHAARTQFEKPIEGSGDRGAARDTRLRQERILATAIAVDRITQPHRIARNV